MKKYLTIVFAFLCISGIAQDDDLFDLSLEELQTLSIKRTTLVDVPHLHNKGNFMVSYAYRNMFMTENMAGDNQVEHEDVLQDYPLVPEFMRMSMHMLGFMYSPSNKVTLMAMMPYSIKAMNVAGNNGTGSELFFNTTAQGIGDLKITSLANIKYFESGQLFGTLGISIPTGSITERDQTPTSGENTIQLPYPMQLGSGTFDPILALTYLKSTDNYGFGLTVNSILRLYNNSRDYKKGNEYSSLLWYSYVVKKYLILTSRLEATFNSSYSGKDSEMSPTQIPTADPNLQSGIKSFAGLGINILPFSNPKMEQFRITLEAKIPIYQNLDGPQMNTGYILNVSVSQVF